MTGEKEIMRIIELREMQKAINDELKTLVDSAKVDAKKNDGLIEYKNCRLWLDESVQERLDTKALYKDFPDIKKEYNKLTPSISVKAVKIQR